MSHNAWDKMSNQCLREYVVALHSCGAKIWALVSYWYPRRTHYLCAFMGAQETW